MSATRKVERVTLRLQMALDRQRAGAELAALRDGKRMTQEDLEEATGLSKRQLQRYEAGSSMPRWKNLDKLADVLGPEVYEIVRDETEDVPSTTPDLTAALSEPDPTLSEIRDLLREVRDLLVAATSPVEARDEWVAQVRREIQSQESQPTPRNGHADPKDPPNDARRAGGA